MVKSSNVKRKRQRRSSLKLISAAVITAGISEQWVKPIVHTIVLPAHADTSGFAANCEINFSREMHVTGNIQEIEIPKTGTFPQDTEIAGVYSGVMPGATSSAGTCSETAIGFQSLPLTITIEEIS